MFKRILIANRGEIAVRIIRACQELDIETIAIYSEADANALHVQLAGHKVCVGGADAADSYLNKTAILRAAIDMDADAIHPGYGFLSEDADFAEQVTSIGLTWIGPMPETIRLVGDKDVARASIAPSGIPMAKGSDPLTSKEEAIEAAAEVGYPVILKPVAGGGGKGMCVAHDEKDLRNILDYLVDVTKTKYYFEHYIERSRHIEVQIVADNYGEVLHLGERECSIQRRNQKLLEESPSIALTQDMRERVGSLAVKAVTGVDLVRTQIRIAAGEPLDFVQRDVHFNGHAIECRINAEDPDNNFMPSPGQINFMHEPSGPRVRFDSGVTAGLAIEPYYDSMIAKIIVHGRTRGDAIKIMQRALNEFRIDGVKTTVSLHKKILKDIYFRTGNIDTQFIKNRIRSYEQEKKNLKDMSKEELANSISASMYYA